MVIFKLPLYPLAVLYDGITRVRNGLYHAGYKRSLRFQPVVISVGNLSVGGTGKTPMIEYLVRSLMPRYRIVTLSRGYGRKTKGLRVASGADNAESLGDEPYQLYLKFGSSITVAVAEQRAPAIAALEQQFPDMNVVLLDDAFQHRPVIPRLSILLTEYAAPFYCDFVLPFGRLRESRSGADRADVVVVTKCPPGISDAEIGEITSRICRYAGSKPVCFASLLYGSPVPFTEGEFNPDVVLVSGIANAKPFEEYVATHYNLIHHFRFPDHHDYSTGDIRAITAYCRSVAGTPSILTTEKDMVKLLPRGAGRDGLSWFSLPVTTQFVRNGADFDNVVGRTVGSAAAKAGKNIVNHQNS